MVGESNPNVFLIQIDASSLSEFEISEFEISRFDCILFGTALLLHLPTTKAARVTNISFMVTMYLAAFKSEWHSDVTYKRLPLPPILRDKKSENEGCPMTSLGIRL